MKKFLALTLALVMSLSLVACGSKEETPAQGGETPAEGTADFSVAMITDYGDITDQSFNQTTYEACKAYCEANGVTFNYFKPAGDSTAERVAMVESAVDEGYTVIVMPGYAFADTIKETAETYPDVTFVALDVGEGDLGDYTLPSNVYCAVYQEELCGYMAGYAAVKMGYTHLGFLGGMAVPAVVRYGYGFVQGADAAAADLGTTATVEYVYGNAFAGDADITAYMDNWYQTLGVEVVFACGGGIYTSAVEAALKNNGYVVGVDVDQNYIGVNGVAKDGYAYNPFVTSAMKGLSESVSTALGDIEAGEWSNIAATNGNFGLEDGDYVGLPTADDSWNFKTFTKDEYETLKTKIASGEIVVDNSSDDATKPTVSEFTKVNYIQ